MVIVDIVSEERAKESSGSGVITYPRSVKAGAALNTSCSATSEIQKLCLVDVRGKGDPAML